VSFALVPVPTNEVYIVAQFHVFVETFTTVP